LQLRFRMAVLMGERWFPYVESSSKKEGKKEAADIALRVLMAEGSYQMNDTPTSVCVMHDILTLCCSLHYLLGYFHFYALITFLVFR